MNKRHWQDFYKKPTKTKKQSLFAEFVMPWVYKGGLVDLGCGTGRDLNYFLEQGVPANGVDESAQGDNITTQDVIDYIRKNESPSFVYARFFWHAITREEQLAILKWARKTIFIEARTIEDRDRKKVYADHDRNYVDVVRLVKDLKDNGYQLLHISEGISFSPYNGEDPHLVRIVARK